MPKTKELEFICVKAQIHSNYDSKIRVVVDVDSNDIAALINTIPQEEIKKYLDDAVFEEWAKENGFVPVAP